jgi:hypothetical protein
MLGIIEEQHPERTRLFMQWKQMDWPVLVDSLNLLGVSAVPMTLLIDEHGIIRAVNPKQNTFQEFLETNYPKPSPAQAGTPGVTGLIAADRLFLQEEPERLGKIIQLYQQALAKSPEEGALHFRLGVAYRKRYDSEQRQAQDFARAVTQWRRALEIDPNQYIWRRRIQQYGPRLDKPYSFYDWVNQARREIRARGQVPIELAVEPGGAEFAQPAKQFEPPSGAASEPDPNGRIFRDQDGLIRVETVVVPNTSAAAASARVHLIFQPNPARKAHWNNEVDGLAVWVNPPAGWEVDNRLLTVKNPPQAVSQEERRLELEVRGPRGSTAEVPAYALYYVCEDVDGTCLYRRQDIRIHIDQEEKRR